MIEVSPAQASKMLDAYWHEQRRIRHEAEPWPSQAERDARKRDSAIDEAVERGVPREQVMRFVRSGSEA